MILQQQQQKTHLRYIRTNEHKINAAKSQLCDTNENVHDCLHYSRPRAQLNWTIFKTLLNGISIIGTLCSTRHRAHFLRASNQHMLTMYRNDGNKNCQDRSHKIAAIFKCIAHCKQSGTDIALKEMYKRLHVPFEKNIV